jgi:hypothetical protein
MNQKITLKLFSLFFIILLQGSYIFAAAPDNLLTGDLPPANTVPVDSPKKAPPAPPAQMLTFPVISSIGKITLSSYAQARYQYYFDEKTASNFDVRNARLIFNGNPFTKVSYRLQVDFAPPTVRLMDAYGAYAFNPFLKVSVGQQKVTLSYESLRTDYDIHSVSRSQVVEALTARSRDVIAGSPAVNNNGRDIGVVVSGAIPNPNTEKNWVEYSAGVFNGSGINKTDADKHKDISGRVVVFPIKQLGIGGSVYQGKATYGADLTKPKDRNRFGFDAAFTTNRLLLNAEFLQGKDSATTKNGYYAQAEGFILPKKLAVLVKYDVYDPNSDKADDGTTVYSFGLNWYFAAFTKIQLQYDYKREEGGEVIQKKNDLFSAQAQVYF